MTLRDEPGAKALGNSYPSYGTAWTSNPRANTWVGPRGTFLPKEIGLIHLAHRSVSANHDLAKKWDHGRLRGLCGFGGGFDKFFSEACSASLFEGRLPGSGTQAKRFGMRFCPQNETLAIILSPTMGQ